MPGKPATHAIELVQKFGFPPGPCAVHCHNKTISPEKNHMTSIPFVPVWYMHMVRDMTYPAIELT